RVLLPGARDSSRARFREGPRSPCHRRCLATAPRVMDGHPHRRRAGPGAEDEDGVDVVDLPWTSFDFLSESVARPGLALPEQSRTMLIINDSRQNGNSNRSIIKRAGGHNP